MPAWLPAAGLIRAHHDYGVYCTDAPPIYHVASMLATVATACADSANLIVNGAVHPLNVWMMLVGASSSDRKTTASKLAVDRLETAIEDRILRIFGSPEGFVEGLKAEPCAMLYVSEGAAFFEQREASYWRHAKGMFMDLYDHTPVFRRKLAKMEHVIKDPRLTILSACAMPLLDYHSKVTDWLGGFLPRFLMIMGEKQEFRPSFRENRATAVQIEGLLWNVYNHAWGAIACSTPALAVLEKFAYEIHGDQSSFHENLHPALNRLPEAAVRLAALYEIANHAANPPSGHLMVSAQSAQHAVALCRESRDIALVRLAEATEGHGVSRELLRVETIVRQTGLAGIKRSELLRRARIHAQDLDKIIFTLTERESIRQSFGVELTTQRGRPAVKYIHMEAEKDAVRAAQNQALDPEPTSWIPVEDWATDEPVFDGLPALEEWDDEDLTTALAPYDDSDDPENDRLVVDDSDPDDQVGILVVDDSDDDDGEPGTGGGAGGFWN